MCPLFTHAGCFSFCSAKLFRLSANMWGKISREKHNTSEKIQLNDNINIDFFVCRIWKGDEEKKIQWKLDDVMRWHAAKAIKRFNENEKQRRKMLRKIQLNIFPTLLNTTMKLHCLSNWPFSSIFDVNGNEAKLLQKLRCFWAFLFESLKLTFKLLAHEYSRSNQFGDGKFIAKKKCWHC